MLPQIVEKSEHKTWPYYVTTTILFIIGIVLGALGQELMGSRVVDDDSLALVIIFLLMALMAVMLYFAIFLMERLYRRVGIKVRYHENDGAGQVYVKCRNVVKKANKSILVLNSYLVEGNRDGQQERAEYYESLLERVTEGGVEYIRIVQHKQDGSNLAELGEDQVHSAHLHRMMDLKHGPAAHRVLLKKCLANRLTTFVLVDGEHLIWQINNVNFEGGKERLDLQGVFIIHDPQQRITQQFEQYFYRLFKGNVQDLRWDGRRFA